MDTGRRVAVWLSPEQVGLLKEVAAGAELEIVAAGSPSRGHSGGVAADLGCKSSDDLRGMLTSAQAELIVIAAPEAFGASANPDDAEAIAAAAGRGVKVATLEPIPAAALDLSGGWIAGDQHRPVDMIHFCPLARLARPFREATEVMEQFGHIRMMSVESWCSPAEGSLGSRLYSALELVVAVLGEAESIDATYVAPSHGTGVHSLPGESLRGLHGDLTANLRFADGRGAAVVASNQGGRWNRTVTMLGRAGRLRIFDDGFEWISPEGKKLDESRKSRRERADGVQPSHAVAALVDSLNRLLDPAIPDPGPPDHATLLAMSQAALLSARTGQAESPATIKHMVGAA